MIKLLVCGGRNYADQAHVNEVLDVLHPRIALIIHGGASGADTLAARWARLNGVHCAAVRALWDYYDDQKAGPIRNRVMLDLLKPDLVVHFPGGAGTRNMTGIALRAGVEVRASVDVLLKEKRK